MVMGPGWSWKRNEEEVEGREGWGKCGLQRAIVCGQWYTNCDKPATPILDVHSVGNPGWGPRGLSVHVCNFPGNLKLL